MLSKEGEEREMMVEVVPSFNCRLKLQGGVATGTWASTGASLLLLSVRYRRGMDECDDELGGK